MTPEPLAALLVFQRSDLAHIADHPDRFAQTRMLFVDPGLLDEASVRGIQNLEFRRINSGHSFQALASTEAVSRATLLDLRLTQERQSLWPQALVQGWDIGLFFLALQRLVVARQLGSCVAAASREDRIGLLRPAAEQQMYFDSSLGPDLLLASDPGRFYVADTYTQVRWTRADAYQQVLDGAGLHTAMAGGAVSLVSHVPTCFYDRVWLASEISRAHHFTLDLPSPVWDVPVHRGSPPVQPLNSAPAADLELAQRYRERAFTVLREALSDLLPQARSRELQLANWADRCRWQALNFMALARGLAPWRPQFLLADQDGGLNGPLFSAAAGLGANITVVPHSGHPSMVFPHAERVTVVERAGYGTVARTVLGQKLPVRAVRLQSGPPRQPPQPLRVVCLLLNAMQTEGLSFVDAPALAAFYRPLEELCRARGVRLVLRAKPGAPALSVLAWLLSCPAETLAQHVRQPLHELATESQLCLAFGEPTTGVAPFLDAGSLVLQVGPQHWPTDYLVSMPLIHDGVIPQLTAEQALQRLLGYIDDAGRFQLDCRAQSAAFDERARLAHDHLF